MKKWHEKSLKEMNQKNIFVGLGIISFFLILGIILFKLVLPTLAVSTTSFNNQCSLPLCPSGYSQSSLQCIGLTCYRGCEKVEKECGSYSTQIPKTSTINVVSSDKNVWKISPSLSLATNKCYQYQILTTFSVTDRSPNFFQSTSDSHEIYLKDNLGKVSQKVKCSSSNTIVLQSNWINIGKGTGQSVQGHGKYVPYAQSVCNAGQDTKGSEGELQVSIAYKSAQIIDKVYSESTQCSFECAKNSDCGSSKEIGGKYCSGNKVMQDYSYPICKRYVCSFETDSSEVETCLSSQICINGNCEDEENDEGTPSPGYIIKNNNCVYTSSGSVFETLEECNIELIKLQDGDSTISFPSSTSTISTLTIVISLFIVFLIIILVVWRLRK